MEQKYYENKQGGLHGNDTYTPIGRIAFVNLVSPQIYKPDPTSAPRYGVTLLIPKDMDKQSLEIIETRIKKEIGDIREAWLKKEFAKLSGKVKYEAFKTAKVAAMEGRPFLRDGDMQKYEGFADHYYIRANNPNREGTGGFLILDGRTPEEFEAGMLCRLQVSPMVDANGVSYKLKAIRLIKDDGVRFKSGAGAPDLLTNLDDHVADAKVSADENGSLMQEYDKAASQASTPARQESSLDVL